VSVDPTLYNGRCGGELVVRVTVTITVSQPTASITFSLTKLGSRTVTATNGTYTFSFRDRVSNVKKDTFNYSLTVTGPSAASSSATFTDDCG
jgi:hypothetical protein